MLDGKHHPCFRCGGKDRFRMIDAEAALYCNACFSTDNGDGISTLRWASGKPFKEVVAMLADYLHLNGNGHVKTSNGKAKLAESDKAIKSIDSPSGDVLLHVYCKAKPPITPDGIKRCGGKLVRAFDSTCIRFDSRAPINSAEPTAIILCRNDGKPFPARKAVGKRRTQLLHAQVNQFVDGLRRREHRGDDHRPRRNHRLAGRGVPRPSARLGRRH